MTPPKYGTLAADHIIESIIKEKGIIDYEFEKILDKSTESDIEFAKENTYEIQQRTFEVQITEENQ